MPSHLGPSPRWKVWTRPKTRRNSLDRKEHPSLD